MCCIILRAGALLSHIVVRCTGPLFADSHEKRDEDGEGGLGRGRKELTIWKEKQRVCGLYILDFNRILSRKVKCSGSGYLILTKPSSELARIGINQAY